MLYIRFKLMMPNITASVLFTLLAPLFTTTVLWFPEASGITLLC